MILVRILEIQALVEYFGARKRTACFVDHQKRLYPGQICRRLKYLSSTRWTSHDRAIDDKYIMIYIYFIHDKFTAIVESLEELATATDRTTSSQATSHLKNVTSYKFVIIMLFMKKLYKITTPVSVYMQSPKLDFIEAMHLVDSAQKRLNELRNDCKYNVLVEEVKQFVLSENLDEHDFPVIRIRKKKKLDEENLHDEIVNTPSLIFKTQVYFFVLDTVSTVLNTRYSQARSILKDFCLLSVERIKLFHSTNNFPDDSFEALQNWIPEINIEALRTEYSAFCAAYSSLISSVNLGVTLHNDQESDNEELNSDDENIELEHNNCSTDNENAASILQLLSKFNLIAAFPNLYLAYKALYTIPVTSAAAERSFSKVKIIKTRLRSTMSQLRLESLLLLNCETDINIDLNKAIDKLGKSSNLMKMSLIFS